MKNAALLLAFLLVSCAGDLTPPLSCPRHVDPVDLARPLPARQAEIVLGIDNFFRLSDRIYSGAEPHGEEAFAVLAARGVRTILSVDGKAPDGARAKHHGLRYVHVPIRYDGITDEELLHLAKVFRELPGPFFVHCYHGRHRGPAAAAVGRLILDRASREQVLGEMRWWCGTSENYGGLYRDVAGKPLPPESATATLDWTPRDSNLPMGMRRLMVELSRLTDQLARFRKNRWAPLPGHPDLSPDRIAATMADLFDGARGESSSTMQGNRFGERMGISAEQCHKLATLLKRKGGALDQGTMAEVEQAYRILRGQCSACHRETRN